MIKFTGKASDFLKIAKHMWEQWNKIKVSVVPDKEVNGEKTKPYMLVEGECSGRLIKAWVLPQFLDSTRELTE